MGMALGTDLGGHSTVGGADYRWRRAHRQEKGGKVERQVMSSNPEPARNQLVKDPRAVFVVHGRNKALSDAMFDFLRAIDLKPIEWDRAVELTEEASPYIGQILDSAFDHAQAVVVLITPDEIAYLQTQYGKGDTDPDILPAAQARPNVLFEAGMALGRDAKRTVLVEVGAVRPFSDVAGRHAIRLTNDTSSRQTLANRLRTAGCPIDVVGTRWHTAGDFTPPEPPGGGRTLGRRVPTTSGRKVVDFDAKFHERGGNRIDKLQVINRGTETAYEVTLRVPEDAALDLQRAAPIDKIPGHGKSVTVDAMNRGRFFGGGREFKDAFDLTISGRTESGEEHQQEVFIDVNGQEWTIESASTFRSNYPSTRTASSAESARPARKSSSGSRTSRVIPTPNTLTSTSVLCAVPRLASTLGGPRHRSNTGADLPAQSWTEPSPTPLRMPSRA
jgi:predicted nucleotide-binding protein